MHPLLITLAFLMLLGTLVTVEVGGFVSRASGERFWRHHLHFEKEKSDEREASLFQEVKERIVEKEGDQVKPKPPVPKKKGERRFRRSASLKFNLSCPPQNSRLNLYPMLCGEESMEGAAELLRRLYGSTSYFSNYGRLEYQILEALKEKKESAKEFRAPDELGSLVFTDKEIERIFHIFLKGGWDENGVRLPSLLHYVTFDKMGSKKINVMFAEGPVLQVVIGDVRLTKEIIDVRNQFWEVIIDQEEHRLERRAEECKNRTQFKEDLEGALRVIFSKYGRDYEKEKHLLDLSLGKMGAVLFVEDEETGSVVREVLPLQKGKSRK